MGVFTIKLKNHLKLALILIKPDLKPTVSGKLPDLKSILFLNRPPLKYKYCVKVSLVSIF